MSDRLKRYLFISAGTVCVGVGAVGVVVPVLPTTPFLLLAAFCYTKGSRRLYTALMGDRLVGAYLKNYIERRGMTIRSKALTLCLLWLGIAAAAVFLTDSTAARVLLGVVLLGVTVHIVTIRTARSHGA